MSGGTANGIIVSDDVKAVFQQADVVIDFTLPHATVQHAKIAAKTGTALVIGTTGPPDIATALDGDAVDERAVSLESSLHAHAMGDLPHGECRVEASVPLTDTNTLKRLQTLAVAFLYPNLNHYRISRREIGDLPVHLLSVELGDYLVGAHYPLPSPNPKAVRYPANCSQCARKT
jgi:hypothetical protein